MAKVVMNDEARMRMSKLVDAMNKFAKAVYNLPQGYERNEKYGVWYASDVTVRCAPEGIMHIKDPYFDGENGSLPEAFNMLVHDEEGEDGQAVIYYFYVPEKNSIRGYETSKVERIGRNPNFTKNLLYNRNKKEILQLGYNLLQALIALEDAIPNSPGLSLRFPTVSQTGLNVSDLKGFVDYPEKTRPGVLLDFGTTDDYDAAVDVLAEEQIRRLQGKLDDFFGDTEEASF